MNNSSQSTWFIYILRCRDDTLYTGITKDIDRRFKEHTEQGPKCAKYLKNRGPFRLVYTESVESHTQALRREIKIKKLTRRKKETLILQLDVL